MLKRSRLKRTGKNTGVTKDLDALLKRAVHLRDHDLCRACGKGKGQGRGYAIQACHIYGKGAHPALRYELRNVITLCQQCHAWTHTYGFGREASTKTNTVRDWYIGFLGLEYMETLDQMVLSRRAKRDPKLVKMYLEQAIKEFSTSPERGHHG
jgi:hypothetical protein